MGIAMSDVEIEIRPAVSSDIDALSAVGLASFKATYGGLSSAADEVAHLDAYFSPDAVAREMALPDRRYLLATVDGQPAGLAKLREGDGPDTIPHSPAIELQQLYVLPDKQRYGIGARLIRAVVDTANNSVRGVWLSVWRQADWATSFYRKLGFTDVGTAEFRIGKTIHTDFLMWLPIDAD